MGFVMKRLVIFLLLIALLAPLCPVVSFSSGEESGGSEGVLFSSSFEKGDGLSLKESLLDGDFVSGIASVAYDEKDVNRPNDFLLVQSISGSPDGFSGEGKINLFDQNADTKYCIDQNTISKDQPIVVSFSLSEPCLASGYRMVSANDGEPRDPKAWNLYASNDGTSWELLDSETNVSFSGRKTSKFFALDGITKSYTQFKLEVISVRGEDRTAKGTLLCQLADFTLEGKITSVSEEESERGDSPMASIRSNGPIVSDAANTNVGFTGYSALRVYGAQSEKENTYARNILYKDLSIKVEENTKLSYVIYPALFDEAYDYHHTSQYMAIDLLFSDGSYLSSLGALDQNGFLLDPVSQGESESLYTMQWNYIESSIGEVAKGKTISAILVYFAMPKVLTKSNFLSYFDDLVIENKNEIVYEHPSDYINILRGTNNTKNVSRGITTPLVCMPNGFNGYTPANTADELLPYYYQENGNGCALRHITVNHTASPWLPGANWGVWQMMVNTSLSPSSVKAASDISAVARAATYTHDNEIARAHYYSVTFNEDDANAAGVTMELTPTEHGAYTRFTYPEGSEQVNLILGTDHGGSVTVKVDKAAGKTIVSGYSDYNGKMYVYSVIDAVASEYKLLDRTVLLSFDKEETVLTMKLATSYLSLKQAEKNLSLEIEENEGFDDVFARAQKAWDDICSMILPEGASYTQLVSLYSSLYRMYSYPVLLAENTGSKESPKWQYLSPYTGKVMDGKMYTINGFWDTYRTEWPALSLLTPEKTGEILDGLLLHYKENGYLARWLGKAGEDCMMGTHSDIIFADAYLKGISFDVEAAFWSMIKNAATDSGSDTYGRKGNTTSIFLGYVPNTIANGLSWTLEDYINDYGISLLAAALADKETNADQKEIYENAAAYYGNRARLYPTMFYQKLGFFMGKNESGAWTHTSTSFNALSVDWWADYAETNAWNMAFSVVFDMNGLAALYGGKDSIIKKLDDFFDEGAEKMSNLRYYTYEQRETRLGLSMYNNQVSLHTAYLYNYFGQPYKTEVLTREILSRHYVGSEIGQGYPGDEDNGAMSAFYVLTALGLYETSLGTGEYLITSPLYDKVTLNLSSGKVTIVANGNSRENLYIQSCKINGEVYDKTYIPYSLLTSGDLVIEYEMGCKPSSWGTSEASAPSSLSSEVKVPRYDTDLAGKTQRTANEVSAKAPTTFTIYGGRATALKKLFDNTSATSASVSNGEAITLSFAADSRVNILTLTSVKATTAPSSVALAYSLDGVNFVTLGEYKTDFTFDKYTLPITLQQTDGGYRYLRLTFMGSDAISLAEIELLGEEMAAMSTPSLPTPPETVPETTPETTPTPAPNPLPESTSESASLEDAPEGEGGQDGEEPGFPVAANMSIPFILLGIGVALAVAVVVILVKRKKN